MSDITITAEALLEADLDQRDRDERIEHVRHVVAQGEEAGYAADYIAAAAAWLQRETGPSDSLFGAARALVALARHEADRSTDPIDNIVLALARSTGGEYALLEAVFRLLDRDETLDAARSLTNWSSYGTETQYAMMRRVARGVVGDSNGARETFADILAATSERAESHPPVRLAEDRGDALVSVSDRPSIYTHRRAARAESIARGETYEAASDAWSAAMSLDHPKAGRS